MNSEIALGVWCGHPVADMLAPISQPGEETVQLLRVTLARARAARAAGTMRALVPWTSHFDPLAADVASWHFPVQRTHVEPLVAMRDLAAEVNARVGVLVWGHAAMVDAAEIHLAVARLLAGMTTRSKIPPPLPSASIVYVSPRLVAYRGEDWLVTNATDEWVEPASARDISLFYAGSDYKRIVASEARAIKARKATS